jgi:hypothetical protein
VFRRRTPEEKAREQQEQALREQQDALAREAVRAERQAAAFTASPTGQARQAYERGDRLLQLELAVKQTDAQVDVTNAGTVSTTTDANAVLNSVCREGWELLNGSFVFQQLGQESREKFFTTGENYAVEGAVIGFYLFRRSEADRGGAA